MKESSVHSKPLLSAVYQFSSTLQHQNPRLNKKYTRKVWVQQLTFKKETTLYQFLCKKFVFDDPHITALIRKCAYIFDVLLITVARDGHIKAVENEKELARKWERLKENLQKDHFGCEFENYMHSFDSVIYHKEKLHAFLEADKMFGLFLRGLSLLENYDPNVYDVITLNDNLKLTKKTEQNRLIELYSFQGDLLQEGLKVQGQLQHEVLCCGIESNDV